MKSFFLLAALGLCAFACGSTVGSGSTSTGSTGTGGTGGGGETSTTSSTGPGGAGGSSCHGDSVAWTKIEATPLDCQKSSDCCVVVNPCLNEAQIVRAVDSAAAATAWPSCDDKCTGCIPPAIQVGCTNGKCVGQDVSAENPAPPSSLRMSHCGTDSVMTPAPSPHFGCGG